MKVPFSIPGVRILSERFGDDIMASKPNKLIICPACGCEQTVAASRLGILGNLEHYRCQGCGMGFSRTLKVKKKKGNHATFKLVRTLDNIVDVCSGNTCLIQVRTCKVPKSSPIIVNKMEVNAVLLEADWLQLVQAVKDAITLANS